MEIKNLGLIKSVNIESKKITVFTGENNTGKTYTSYILYGIFSFLKNIDFVFIQESEIENSLKSSIESGSNSTTFKLEKENIKTNLLKTVNKGLRKGLKGIALDTFKIKESEFKELDISLSEREILTFYNFDPSSPMLTKKISFGENTNIEIKDDGNSVSIQINFSVSEDSDLEQIIKFSGFIINKEILHAPNEIFYIPAERTGINVFKNELNESRLKTYDTMMNTIQYASLKNKKGKNNLEQKLFRENLDLFLGVAKSSYPKPISDYINFLNNMSSVSESQNKDDKITPGEYIRSEILNGKYEINDDDNSVFFRHKYGTKMYRTKTTPFHVASSSIKSLFGLDYFLDNVGEKGDYLIIDEPELSLHYRNQQKLASFFYELIKYGYKIILSTHSDILIRELTNLVLESKLNNEVDFEKDIKIYNFKNGSATDLGNISEINNYENFDTISFDIDDRYSELIYYLRKKNEE